MWIAWGLLCASLAVPDSVYSRQHTVIASQPGRSDDELGVDAARTEMWKLSALVGVFDLSAKETSTDGARFTESGTRTCRWAFGYAAILCEEARTLESAIGRYERLPAYRRSMSLLRWNPSARHYEEVEVGLTGPATIRALTYEASRPALTYESVVESSTMNGKLIIWSDTTIGNYQHDRVQRLCSQTTDLREEYRETALRRSWPMNFVGHWKSTATHYHRDGTIMVETGHVVCGGGVSALVCDRDYIGGGRNRIGIQVWTYRDDNVPHQVLSVAPQSRVVQQVTEASARELFLEGSITGAAGPVRTRGRWQAVGGDLIYRNETEESAGRWRLDYEERLTRF